MSTRTRSGDHRLGLSHTIILTLRVRFFSKLSPPPTPGYDEGSSADERVDDSSDERSSVRSCSSTNSNKRKRADEEEEDDDVIALGDSKIRKIPKLLDLKHKFNLVQNVAGYAVSLCDKLFNEQPRNLWSLGVVLDDVRSSVDVMVESIFRLAIMCEENFNSIYHGTFDPLRSLGTMIRHCLLCDTDKRGSEFIFFDKCTHSVCRSCVISRNYDYCCICETRVDMYTCIKPYRDTFTLVPWLRNERLGLDSALEADGIEARHDTMTDIVDELKVSMLRCKKLQRVVEDWGDTAITSHDDGESTASDEGFVCDDLSNVFSSLESDLASDSELDINATYTLSDSTTSDSIDELAYDDDDTFDEIDARSYRSDGTDSSFVDIGNIEFADTAFDNLVELNQYLDTITNFDHAFDDVKLMRENERLPIIYEDADTCSG